MRREKALIHSGWKSRPGTGSLHPVAIGAAAEATKLLKPPVKRAAKATRQICIKIARRVRGKERAYRGSRLR